MQRDRALIPVEGLRLAALGILARQGPMAYASLATMVRLFATSYGASPVDVMSSSIELLRFEGLIEIGEREEDQGSAPVALTARGREELERLMIAPIKVAGAYAKLLVALKMRFFHLLGNEEKKRLAEVLGDALRAKGRVLSICAATWRGGCRFPCLARPRPGEGCRRTRVARRIGPGPCLSEA